MTMRWMLAAPSVDDVVRVLRAWRFWVGASVVGGLLGGLLYLMIPPPYRAQATVLVDFNLEEAWPQETDRQQFYYLERETRKLEEIAWSDAVLESVAEADGLATVSALRGGQLHLSQPGEGGWHFFADSASSRRASLLASTWALQFVRQAGRRIGADDGLNRSIELEVTQGARLPVTRSTPMGVYLLAGSLQMMFLSSLVLLFIRRKPKNSKRA
jgi:hypothetical protein